MAVPVRRARVLVAPAGAIRDEHSSEHHEDHLGVVANNAVGRAAVMPDLPVLVIASFRCDRRRKRAASAQSVCGGSSVKAIERGLHQLAGMKLLGDPNWFLPNCLALAARGRAPRRAARTLPGSRLETARAEVTTDPGRRCAPGPASWRDSWDIRPWRHAAFETRCSRAS